MIHCFFDDSGKESDAGNRFVCIAGYMAVGDDWWTMLSNAWGHQLFRYGLSWLHMKDFMNEQGEYGRRNGTGQKRKLSLKSSSKSSRAARLSGLASRLKRITGGSCQRN